MASPYRDTLDNLLNEMILTPCVTYVEEKGLKDCFFCFPLLGNLIVFIWSASSVAPYALQGLKLIHATQFLPYLRLHRQRSAPLVHN